MPTVDLTHLDTDPYSTVMAGIVELLRLATERSGGMSEGEFEILGEIGRVVLEEDPSVGSPIVETWG